MKKRTIVLLTILLVAVLAVSAVGYRWLSGKVTPSQPAPSAQSASAAAVKAADFTVYDTEGNAVTLSSMIGKPTVVNVWATWCPPCKAELPYFNNLYAADGNAINVMMVNVGPGSGDTAEIVRAFVQENGYTFPVYEDTDGSAARAYGVSSIPVTLFIDRDGNLIGKTVGSMDEQTLNSYVDTIR